MSADTTTTTTPTPTTTVHYHSAWTPARIGGVVAIFATGLFGAIALGAGLAHVDSIRRAFAGQHTVTFVAASAGTIIAAAVAAGLLVKFDHGPEDLRPRVSELQSELNKAKGDLGQADQRARGELQAEKAGLEAEKARLQAERAGLQAERAELESDRGKFQAESLELRRTIENGQSLLDAANRQIDAERAAKDAAIASAAAEQAAALAAVTEKEDALQRVTLLINQRDQLVTKINQLETERATLLEAAKNEAQQDAARARIREGVDQADLIRAEGNLDSAQHQLDTTERGEVVVTQSVNPDHPTNPRRTPPPISENVKPRINGLEETNPSQNGK